MKNRILTFFLITVLPFAAKSQTTEWLDSVALQPTPNWDMGYVIEGIQYSIYLIKEDSSRAYLDSVNLSGKPKYEARCAANTKKYLADLTALDSACASWLKTKSITNLPTLQYAYYILDQTDSLKATVYFGHFSNGYHNTNTGYEWNDDTLCLPESFNFVQYKNIQQCIRVGLIIATYNYDLDGIPDASHVEPIAFNSVSKEEQAEKLLNQINKILNLAQHQPKLKGLPSPTEYAKWEKEKNFASLEEVIKIRTNVLLKFSEKL
jgi:hypothetical protein